MEVLDDFDHFSFVYLVLIGELGFFNGVRQSWFIVNSHDLSGEVLQNALSHLDVNFAISIQVVVIEYLVNMSLNRLIIAICWSSIWQLID